MTSYECHPIHRHPADESPPLFAFSSTVSAIRAYVEHTLQHPVNHVIIHTIRARIKVHLGTHSDNTVNVVRGSRIVSISLVLNT